jgi:arabinogalactan endo-1,4-beta-galactosidase
MKLVVDFHYSDFWADPGKQMAPLAWKGMNINEKIDALYAFTCDSLLQLKKAGVDVGMVQIGNETNSGLAGETQWENMAKLFSAGAKAVRDTLPEALVAVHFTNPEKPGAYGYYGQQLANYQVDYDVFATSYYPMWHGSLENLQQVLKTIHETYGKQVLVAETSHAYTPENLDYHPNTVNAQSQTPYPKTLEGQASWVKDVANAVAQIPGGMGVFYWEGTWISAGGGSYEENKRLWEAHGSGWASSFAAAYDPWDAGKYYGGCAVENQAFFDSRGMALESLAVFSEIRQSLLQQK